MHPVMRDQLEKALAGSPDEATRRHLNECPECGAQFALMLEQAAGLRALRVPEGLEPRAGFYARVMERIEAQGASIWDLFFESAFGKRIAYASLALAVLLGVYLVTMERSEEPMVAATEQVLPVDPAPPLPVISTGLGAGGGDLGLEAPDQDSVLVNLVTYREQ